VSNKTWSFLPEGRDFGSREIEAVREWHPVKCMNLKGLCSCERLPKQRFETARSHYQDPSFLQ